MDLSPGSYKPLYYKPVNIYKFSINTIKVLKYRTKNFFYIINQNYISNNNEWYTVQFHLGGEIYGLNLVLSTVGPDTNEIIDQDPELQSYKQKKIIIINEWNTNITLQKKKNRI